jgi:hypothetical protein
MEALNRDGVTAKTGVKSNIPGIYLDGVCSAMFSRGSKMILTHELIKAAVTTR